jgi:hypothetical protein
MRISRVTVFLKTYDIRRSNVSGDEDDNDANDDDYKNDNSNMKVIVMKIMKMMIIRDFHNNVA